MKRFTAIALLALPGLLMAGNNLSAQDRQVQASIPFAFRVGNAPLPAGTYRISKSDNGIITVANYAHPSLRVFTMTSETTSTDRGAGKLIFNKYGDQYFLSRVLAPSSMTVVVPTSKLEKRARTETARLGYGGTVLLALK